MEKSSVIVPKTIRLLESAFYLLLEGSECRAFVGDLEERYRAIRQIGSGFGATLWLCNQVIISFWPLLWAAVTRSRHETFTKPTATIESDDSSSGPNARLSGLSTGFLKFDEMTGGLHGGELFVLAARPSMGKTAMALTIAQHVAMHPQIRKPVAVFSLEMSSASVLTRLLCAVARVDQHKFRMGLMNPDERRKLQAALLDATEAPLFVDDTGGLTLADINTKLRRMKSERGLSLVVIDYLQLMGRNGNSETRSDEISTISRGLKQIAKDLDVPVLVLSQLSRPSETRNAASKPTLRDLDDSGSIDQEADLVAFIHREEVYRRDREDLRGFADLIIAKQRNGPTGTVRLRFQGPYTRFDNRAEDLLVPDD
jgi:replicative DNA helicase